MICYKCCFCGSPDKAKIKVSYFHFSYVFDMEAKYFHEKCIIERVGEKFLHQYQGEHFRLNKCCLCHCCLETSKDLNEDVVLKDAVLKDAVLIHYNKGILFCKSCFDQVAGKDFFCFGNKVQYTPYATTWLDKGF